MFGRVKQQFLEKVGKAQPTEDPEETKKILDKFALLEKRYGNILQFLTDYIKSTQKAQSAGNAFADFLREMSAGESDPFDKSLQQASQHHQKAFSVGEETLDRAGELVKVVKSLIDTELKDANDKSKLLRRARLDLDVAKSDHADLQGKDHDASKLQKSETLLAAAQVKYDAACTALAESVSAAEAKAKSAILTEMQRFAETDVRVCGVVGSELEELSIFLEALDLTEGGGGGEGGAEISAGGGGEEKQHSPERRENNHHHQQQQQQHHQSAAAAAAVEEQHHQQRQQQEEEEEPEQETNDEGHDTNANAGGDDGMEDVALGADSNNEENSE